MTLLKIEMYHLEHPIFKSLGMFQVLMSVNGFFSLQLEKKTIPHHCKLKGFAKLNLEGSGGGINKWTKLPARQTEQQNHNFISSLQ